jgi:hypothetical protein
MCNLARRFSAFLNLGLMLALIRPGLPISAVPPELSNRPVASVCPPLPPPSGNIVNVATVAALQSAVDNLTSNTTILIADGTYDLTNLLNIRGVNNVTLRSASGNREAVILRGKGMSNSNYGNVPHVIAIYDANDVTIADLTLRDAYYHLVQVHGEDGPQRPRFYNLHLMDAGEQFIKGSTNPAQLPRQYADDGTVECSLFEYADRARSYYTNAVDVLAGANWIIRDNVFRRIRAPVGQLAGPAILMWRNSLNTIVERNQFIECDRAVALGLSPPDANSRNGETTYDHQGGIIRNNFVYRAAGSATGDVGLAVNYANNYQVHHNTVLLNDSFPWTIEYRFSVSNGALAYNLTDGPILQRDSAQGATTGNLTNATLSWFVNPASGDLHLKASAVAAINQALPLANVLKDVDDDPRPIGPAPDIGADEYGLPAPITVSDLRVINAITAGGILTATLTWSAPNNAITDTLRYSTSVILEANWASATLLTNSLPGTADSFTASVPSTGGTVYFAFKAQNVEGVYSGLSNNAFWPTQDLYLPLLRR